jgi:hypothetical protein
VRHNLQRAQQRVPQPPTRNPHLEKAADSILQQRPAAMAVARKIGYQFPRVPEGALMRAIFQQTVVDLFLRSYRHKACRHLQGRIYEAEVCGIDAEWIRRQFAQAGVSLDEQLR